MKTEQRSLIHFESCNYSNTERYHIDEVYCL